MGLTQFYGQSFNPHTMDHLSAGIYKINHTSGHTNYTVLFTMRSQGTYAVLYEKSNTYFIVHIRNFSNTLVDAEFEFSVLGDA